MDVLTKAMEKVVVAVDGQRAIMQQWLSSQGVARTDSPVTPSHLGYNSLERLRAADSIRVPGDGIGDAVLTPAQQAALLTAAAREKEKGVVKYLTPILAPLCLPPPVDGDPCKAVLVNSEALPWLAHGGALGRRDLRLKPDLFMSWDPFVTYASPGAGHGTSDDYRFGALSGHALQMAGCVRGLFEAKLDTMGTRDFGELCTYHQCLPGAARGMLFNRSSFWLYYSFDGSPFSLEKYTWVSAGTADAVRAFFAGIVDPPLVVLLRALLAGLGVSPLHGVDGRCYLGSGATGHVFTVGGATRPRALKVVLDASGTTRVEIEYSRLLAAAAAGAPVVRPVEGSLLYFGSLKGGRVSGGGYLLEAVGEPFSVTSQARCEMAFESLAELHRAGVIHGDARLPNLLLVDERAAWIDMSGSVMGVGPSLGGVKQLDARTLAWSVLALAVDAPLPAAVASAVESYSADNHTANAVAAAVWTARSIADAGE